MERAERLKSFKTWREGLQSHLPLTIFLCNPPVLREGTSLHLGTPRHSLKLRYVTAAISHISSASAMLECWQNLSKLTNQRVYQILVYRKDLLLSLPTVVLLLPLAAHFFYLFARCFPRWAVTNWSAWKRLLISISEIFKVNAFL